jgi:hypothetical protein
MERPCCLRFEDFALQSLFAQHPELKGQPVAFYDRRNRIVQASREALAAGVRNGMGLREAAAFLTTLALFPRSEFSSEALEAVALALLVCSPQVARFGEEEIFVDLAPSRHLFGGENQMIAALVSLARERFGYSCTACAADSIAAARLGAYANIPSPSVGEGRVGGGARWHSLPIQALFRLPEFAAAAAGEAGRMLAYLGIETLGDLAASAASLAALPDRGRRRRLRPASAHPPRPVGQAQGPASTLASLINSLKLYATCSRELEQGLRFVREEGPISLSCPFSPPIVALDLLLPSLEESLGRVQEELYRARRLASRLELALLSEAGEETVVVLELVSPTRNRGVLGELCRIKLGQIRLAAPLTQYRLCVVQSVAEVGRGAELFDGDGGLKDGGALARLSNRLDAGLGRRGAFFQAVPVDALLPEHRAQPFTGAPRPASADPQRPASLSSEPAFLFFGPAEKKELAVNVPPADLAPAYAFEFYEQGRYALSRHEYFHVRRHGKRLLLKRESGAGILRAVGIDE